MQRDDCVDKENLSSVREQVADLIARAQTRKESKAELLMYVKGREEDMRKRGLPEEAIQKKIKLMKGVINEYCPEGIDPREIKIG